MKAGKITSASFDLAFEDNDTAKTFEEYLKSCNVVITKKTKKGDIKVEEVSSKIINISRKDSTVSLVLPAGNDNLNPSLLVKSFNEEEKSAVNVLYTRTAGFGGDGKLFI